MENLLFIGVPIFKHIRVDYLLTVNNIAGIGVNLLVLIIDINSGKWPSLAPTKNNLGKNMQ